MKKKLLLIVPISKEHAFRNIEKNIYQKIKSGTRRILEKKISQMRKSIVLTDFHFRTSHYSNRGDIAIGESSIQTFTKLGHDIDTLAWDDLSIDKTEYINATYDAVILAGGGYIFLDSSGRLNQRANDIGALKKISKPIIAYGIGLNRLMHEEPFKTDCFYKLPFETKEYLRDFCDCLSLLGVRDKDTRILLEPYCNNEIFLIGDPVLFYEPEIKKNNSIIASNIGFNCAAHSWRTISVLTKIMPIFEKFLTNAAKNKNISYFVHENLEYPVYDYLDGRGFFLSKIDGSTDHMLNHYSQCQLVVNQMLHSSIFAFNRNTPSVNVAYDLKSVAFFELFGLQEFCIPWNLVTEQKLIEAIEKIDTNRNEIKESILKGKIKITIERNSYFSNIENIF